MSARPRGGNRLTAFVVVVLMLFLLAIFVVVGIPTIDMTADSIQATDSGAIKSQGLDDNMGFVLDVGMVFAPTFFGIGIIAYLYAVVAGKGSFRGAR